MKVRSSRVLECASFYFKCIVWNVSLLRICIDTQIETRTYLVTGDKVSSTTNLEQSEHSLYALADFCAYIYMRERLTRDCIFYTYTRISRVKII